RGYFSGKNPRPTALALAETLLVPVVRHHRRLIWEARLEDAREASAWAPGERLQVVGPDNIAQALSAPARAFVEATGAAAELEGVRRGDWLFIVESGGEPVSYSFVFFETTRATRRQARILRERPGSPIIGLSFTAPAVRGHGLYRRILNEMFLR